MKKTNFYPVDKSSFFRGWGIGIRTPTNRVRVCRATVTPFPNAGDSDNRHILCLRVSIIHTQNINVNIFTNFFSNY